MFRARSMPFPSRSAEAVHSLRPTRRPVYSRAVLGSVLGATREPAASWVVADAFKRGTTRGSAQFSPRCAELSNWCSMGLEVGASRARGRV